MTSLRSRGACASQTAVKVQNLSGTQLYNGDPPPCLLFPSPPTSPLHLSYMRHSFGCSRLMLSILSSLQKRQHCFPSLSSFYELSRCDTSLFSPLRFPSPLFGFVVASFASFCIYTPRRLSLHPRLISVTLLTAQKWQGLCQFTSLSSYHFPTYFPALSLYTPHPLFILSFPPFPPCLCQCFDSL